MNFNEWLREILSNPDKLERYRAIGLIISSMIGILIIFLMFFFIHAFLFECACKSVCLESDFERCMGIENASDNILMSMEEMKSYEYTNEKLLQNVNFTGIYNGST